jgi:membrane protein involved in colicin uptake
MKTKVCSKCKKEKERKEFNLDRRQKHELYSQCKSCVKAYYEANKEKIAERKKAYNEANKEKIAERNKAYHEANKEKIAEKKKAYNEANKEKIAEKKKAYYEANKEKVAAQNKAYRENNKEKIAAYRKDNNEKVAAQNKAYRENNKEKIAAYRKDNKEKIAAYHRARHKSDPIYNLSCRCRGRISAAIRAKGFKKTTKTAEMLGCDWEFLKSHIESQFKDGMSWENRKEWHIDHIIPLASASSEDDIIRLCHFSNLQPLWAEDNLRKKNRIVECQPELTLKH